MIRIAISQAAFDAHDVNRPRVVVDPLVYPPQLAPPSLVPYRSAASLLFAANATYGPTG
jgi:hypothetical protein